MSKTKTTIFSLIPFILLLVVLEVAGRIIYPFDPTRRADIMAQRDPRVNLPYLATGKFSAEQILSDIHNENQRYVPLLGWLGKPNLVRATIKNNELGFRDGQVEARKPNEVRVLILGGSAAWGLGASANSNTVSGALQALLNDHGAKRTYRVMNAAYPAWTSQQELVALMEFYDRFDPDLVVALTGYNDLSVLSNEGMVNLVARPESKMLAQAVEQQLRPMDTMQALNKVAGSLGIWRVVVYFREKSALARTKTGEVEFHPDLVHAGVARIVDRYLTMGDFARRHGSRLLIALQPDIYTTKKNLTAEELDVKNRFTSRLKNIGETYSRYRTALLAGFDRLSAYNVSTIDLGNALNNVNEPVFIDDCHLNDTGYRRLAAALAPAVMQGLKAATTPDLKQGIDEWRDRRSLGKDNQAAEQYHQQDDRQQPQFLSLAQKRP